MKNNRGFTLIELIVVIAIIGILAGVASYSINYVSTARVKKFTNELNTMLAQCRVETLSGAPSPTYVELSLSDGKYTCTLHENDKVKASEQLGRNNIKCQYKTDGAAPVDISSICFGFDRSTGAFLELDKVLKADGITKLNGDVHGVCTEILIGDTGITLVPETGFHSVGIS